MQRYQIVRAKQVMCSKLSLNGILLFFVESKLSLVVMALRMVDARRVF